METARAACGFAGRAHNSRSRKRLLPLPFREGGWGVGSRAQPTRIEEKISVRLDTTISTAATTGCSTPHAASVMPTKL